MKVEPPSDAVADRRPALQAAQVQRAYIGDVVAGAAAAVRRQRHRRRCRAGVEGEGEGGVVGVTGDVGRPHDNVVEPLHRAEVAGEGSAAVDAVADRGAGLEAAEGERAHIGDVVAGAAAAVGGQRHPRRRRAGVEGEGEAAG